MIRSCQSPQDSSTREPRAGMSNMACPGRLTLVPLSIVVTGAPPLRETLIDEVPAVMVPSAAAREGHAHGYPSAGRSASTGEWRGWPQRSRRKVVRHGRHDGGHPLVEVGGDGWPGALPAEWPRGCAETFRAREIQMLAGDQPSARGGPAGRLADALDGGDGMQLGPAVIGIQHVDAGDLDVAADRRDLDGVAEARARGFGIGLEHLVLADRLGHQVAELPARVVVILGAAGRHARAVDEALLAGVELDVDVGVAVGLGNPDEVNHPGHGLAWRQHLEARGW